MRKTENRKCHSGAAMKKEEIVMTGREREERRHLAAAGIGENLNFLLHLCCDAFQGVKWKVRGEVQF